MESTVLAQVENARAVGHPPSRLGSHWVWFVLAVELVVSGILSFVTIGSKSLYWDEGASVALARDSFTQLIHAESNEENQMLYYVVLHWWMRLGDTEAALRALSAIFAVATVAAVFLLARRLYGDTIAVVAGLLMATAPFAVQYAQITRGYTMEVALAVISTHLFLRAVDRPTPRRLLTYAVSIVACVYAHDFGVFVLVSQFGWLLMTGRSRRAAKAYLLTGLSILVLLVPEAIFVYHGRGRGVFWVAPLSFAEAKHVASTLFGGQVLFVCLAGTLLAGASIFLQRTFKDRSLLVHWIRSSESSLLVIWLVAPIVLTVVISFFKPLLVNRYLLICVPPALILTARALSLLFVQPARVVVTVGLLVLGLAGTVGWYDTASIEDFRSAAAVIAAARPDAVIEYPYRLPPADYYFQRDGLRNGTYRKVVASSRSSLLSALDRLGRHPVWLIDVLTHDGSEGALLSSIAVGSAQHQSTFRGAGPSIGVAELTSPSSAHDSAG